VADVAVRQREKKSCFSKLRGDKGERAFWRHWARGRFQALLLCRRGVRLRGAKGSRANERIADHAMQRGETPGEKIGEKGEVGHLRSNQKKMAKK